MVLREGLNITYRRANDLTGGSLGVLRGAAIGFSGARAAEAAASLAYYALFSLFPLLILLVAVGSLFLERDQVYAQAVGLVTAALPISHELIERNIDHVLELRGTIEAPLG
jgi:membrane protein